MCSKAIEEGPTSLIHTSAKKLDWSTQERWQIVKYISTIRAMIFVGEILRTAKNRHVLVDESLYIHEECFIAQLDEVERILNASDSTT